MKKRIERSEMRIKNLKQELKFLLKGFFVSFSNRLVHLGIGHSPFLAICYALCAFGYLNAGDWGAVQKKISVQFGTVVSAWSDAGRSDVTEAQFGSSAPNMTAEGDGTYAITMNLLPNAEYNYIFFAEASGVTYYDAVNNSRKGTIIVSTSATQLTSATTAYLGSVGGDARRILEMPDVEPGTTVYVLNNFGDAPNPPKNVRAFPGQSAVRLKWDEPDTAWGSGGAMRAADVLIGGGFRIFKSTDIANGYSDVGFRPGSTATANTVYEYMDSGLATGVTYFYIIVSSDAYTGGMNMMKVPNLTSGLPGPGTAQQVKSRTGRPVEIYFKVQEIDWDKVQRKDYVVWLTPQKMDARFYRGKLKGRIIQVYLPPDGEEKELLEQLEVAEPLPEGG